MKFQHLSGAARIVLGMFVGIVLWANYGPHPSPVEFTKIRVDTITGEPDTIVKWREKIVYKTVTVTQQVTVEHGADSTVTQFCRAAVTDSASHSPESPTLPVPPALIRSGAYDGKTLTLYEAIANGDLRREQFKTHAPFTFAIRPEGALVQRKRTWWVKPLAKDLLKIGAGYAVGRLQP